MDPGSGEKAACSDAFEEERQLALEGTHPDMREKALSLLNRHEKRAFASSRFRDLQRLNHTALYEYEIKESEAVCSEGIRDVKAALLSELDRKRELLKRRRDAVTASLARALQLKLRREQQRDAQAEAESPDDPMSGLRKRKICIFAPEAEIRDDLREIVEDLRATVALAASCAAPARVEALVDVETASLKCDGATFALGDVLSVFSRLVDKEFIGRLDGLSRTQLTLRLPGGQPRKLELEHLRTGDIAISSVGDAS